jgi:hypothetical protein
MRRFCVATFAGFLWASPLVPTLTAAAADTASDPGPAVGAQYDSTHVYIAPGDFDRFVASFIATFGGTATARHEVQVTPTPSTTLSQAVVTPVGLLSVFGFSTPIPYPFGTERSGNLVVDIDKAVQDAKAAGAATVVSVFTDPIGRDAIIQWPGGVNMQLYWHFTPPSSPPLQTIPESHVYAPPEKAAEFVRDYLRFSRGTIVSDDAQAPGIEIGSPNDTYHRIRLTSPFGKMTALATDGHLPYPYGYELTGYQVSDLNQTIARAKAAGVALLAGPYLSEGRQIAILQFPGGYIAEVHAPSR